jgi:autotransporter passenger strand-loop-strand repeat protein
VLSGGEIEIYAGATVSGLTVSSGGIEVFVSSGATTTATVTATTTAATDQTASVQTNAIQSTIVDTSATVTAGAVAAPPGSVVVESTVANLIQAMAGFAGRAGDGALFESVSGGWLHEDAGTLAAPHRPVSRS